MRVEGRRRQTKRKGTGMVLFSRSHDKFYIRDVSIAVPSSPGLRALRVPKKVSHGMECRKMTEDCSDCGHGSGSG